MAASSSPQSHYEIYRGSSLGAALIDALDKLISDQKIAPQVAIVVLKHFDEIVANVLQTQVTANMSFRAARGDYSEPFPEVWRFSLKDVTFKLEGGTALRADRIKVVAMKAQRPSEG